MKDIYKNPILYCIVVPIIVALWPLLVWAIYLPAAQKDVEEQITQYKRAEPIMMEILALDPDRVEFVDSNDTATEFTFGGAVDRIANLCRIPPSKCKLSSGMIINTPKKGKSQTAVVDLKQVDIATFAKFLSMIQLRWTNLQCERVELNKKEGQPDVWDVTIKFKYYY